MLILSRRPDETICIGDDVLVTICGIEGDRVRVGVVAPKAVQVHRLEVKRAIERENRAAARPETKGGE